MAKIEVTMEKSVRVAMEFEATEEQIKQLEFGENPFKDQMEKELNNGDVHYDFAAVYLPSSRSIKDWE